MRIEKLYEALGDINEKYICEAKMEKHVKKNALLKWGSIAACLAVMVIAIVIPMAFSGDDPVPPIASEYAYEKGYFYNVDEGAFSAYVGGKVIAEEKIGSKISDVSLTAGWKNDENVWISTEKLRGEVYSINGISSDTAVALKFIDKGEAVTTTHYYVIMNPDADLSEFEDYIIVPITSNNPGDEIAGEIIVYE